MSDQLSRLERVNAFIAAMGQEEYYRILDFAKTVNTNGYAPNLTYDEIVDRLIDKQYEKAEGLIQDVGFLPIVAKLEDDEDLTPED